MALAVGMPVSAATTGIVPGELVVKMKPNSGAITAQSSSIAAFYDLCDDTGANAIRAVGSKPALGTQAVQGAHFYRISYAESADIPALISQFKALEGVQYVEPSHYVYASQSISDPVELSKTELAQLQSIPANSQVIVAVVDSGVDYTHEALAGQLLINTADPIDGIDNDRNGYVDDYYGYNFDGDGSTPSERDPIDKFGHGTHIAGVVAARADSSYPGVNPNAKILNVRFLDERGRGTDTNGAEAIYYAVDRGVRIINCSWGYFTPSQTLRDAVDYAAARGAIVVAASGNDNSLDSEYPAAFDSVFAVGSVNSDHVRSSYSNYGAYLDFMALGRRVMGLKPGNGYQSLSGTSQSAAVLSGTISRVLGFDSTMSSTAVYDILKTSCVDLDRSGKDILTGYGLVDSATLVAALAAETDNDADTVAETTPTQNIDNIGVFSLPVSVTRVMNFPNPVRSSSNKFGLNVSESATVKIDIYSQQGRKVKEIATAVSEGYNTIDWAPTDDAGAQLSNGTYFYIVAVTASGQTQRSKGMLSIVR